MAAVASHDEIHFEGDLAAMDVPSRDAGESAAQGLSAFLEEQR